MRKGRATTTTLPRISAARLFVVLISLLAFGLQSYVTQTHIHFKTDTFGSYASLNKQKPAGPDKYPGSGDPSNCPICQEIAHTGHFVMPSAAALSLPNSALTVATVVMTIPPAAQRPSHLWQSRAPPRA
jgi:hypothetical protein